MTTPHADHTHAETPEHPWATAWDALSPQRRAALHGRVVDRLALADLAARLGRTEEDAEALVGSTLVAFRREVVLGIGTGYAEDCGALVLRLVDSTQERLTRAERKALAAHADTCPECARAVGEFLELDARLRDGLIALVGTEAPATPVVPAPRVAVEPAAAPDSWAPAFERLSPERRTALVHGAAGAESVGDLAKRLGTTEPAARTLAASSLLAFRQTVLRALPVGTGVGCDLVAAHRTDDVTLDAARTRALRAHAEVCAVCAPVVGEILALQESLRPRVAGLAHGAGGAAWLRSRPRRSWVPGVERPSEPVDRRRVGIGAGLAATAVTALVLVTGMQGADAPLDVVVAAPPAAAAEAPAETDTVQVVLTGNRIASRTPVAQDAATAAPVRAGSGTASTGGSTPQAAPEGVPAPDEGPGGGPGKGPGKGPQEPGDPGDPGEEPTPPLDVAVDTQTGSITVTVGLLGEPIVISTPPITR